MNPHAAQPVRRPTHAQRPAICRPGLVLLLACVGGLGLFTACSRTATDFSAVQASLVESSGCDWARQIRIGVPSFLFTVARAGLGFVDMDPEARAAIQTMRGLRLAIYERAAGTPDRAQMLQAADRAMSSRGWDRVVGVLDGRQLVAVFAPTGMKAGGNLELCVIVFDGDQLVFVSGRADPEPLVQVALRHVSAERERLISKR